MSDALSRPRPFLLALLLLSVVALLCLPLGCDAPADDDDSAFMTVFDDGHQVALSSLLDACARCRAQALVATGPSPRPLFADPGPANRFERRASAAGLQPRRHLSHHHYRVIGPGYGRV